MVASANVIGLESPSGLITTDQMGDSIPASRTRTDLLKHPYGGNWSISCYVSIPVRPLERRIPRIPTREVITRPLRTSLPLMLGPFSPPVFFTVPAAVAPGRWCFWCWRGAGCCCFCPRLLFSFPTPALRTIEFTLPMRMNGTIVWIEPENVSRFVTRGPVVFPPACMLLGAVNDMWLGR